MLCKSCAFQWFSSSSPSMSGEFTADLTDGPMWMQRHPFPWGHPRHHGVYPATYMGDALSYTPSTAGQQRCRTRSFESNNVHGRLRDTKSTTSSEASKKNGSSTLKGKNARNWNERTANGNNFVELGNKHKQSSKYRGVSWHKRDKGFVARVWRNGQAKHLGIFSNEVAAALAVDKALLAIHGPHAKKLNFPKRNQPKGLLETTLSPTLQLVTSSAEQRGKERNTRPDREAGVRTIKAKRKRRRSGESNKPNTIKHGQGRVRRIRARSPKASDRDTHILSSPVYAPKESQG